MADSASGERGTVPVERELADIRYALRLLMGHRTQLEVQAAARLAGKTLSKFLNARQAISLDQLLEVGRALELAPAVLFVRLGKEIAKRGGDTALAERELAAVPLVDHVAAIRSLRQEVEGLHGRLAAAVSRRATEAEIEEIDPDPPTKPLNERNEPDSPNSGRGPRGGSKR